MINIKVIRVNNTNKLMKMPPTIDSAKAEGSLQETDVQKKNEKIHSTN